MTRIVIAAAFLIAFATTANAATVESVTSNSVVAEALRNALFEGANQARVPVQELTDLFVCVVNATRGDGHTFRELVDVAVSLEMMQTLGGATGTERVASAQAGCNLLRDLPH